MEFDSEENARIAIVEAGKVLYDQGYVVSNDGNISVKVSENTIVVTPTGVSKGSMSVSDMVVMDLDGNVLSQGTRGPSSEVKMHLRVYREDPKVNAVVHAHPIYATSFAVAGIALDKPIMSEAVLQVGAVPVAHYAKPGTHDVPDSALREWWSSGSLGQSWRPYLWHDARGGSGSHGGGGELREGDRNSCVSGLLPSAER